MITRAEALSLLRRTASKWNAHNAPRLGAALAFYSLLSLAPLLILILAICGLVFSKTDAEYNLLRQAQALIGPSGARTLKMVIDSTHHGRSGVFAGAVAVVATFFGASGVFVELRDSLNLIWDVPSRGGSGWRGMLAQRIASFAMVLGLGLLLMISLALSAGLKIMEQFFRELVPIGFAAGGEALNFTFSFLAITIFFALIFKFVPDAAIAWRDVAAGAFITAIFFSVGRALLSLYLGTAGIRSAYGAAGSLVVLVVWVYYSAQIFFFGAIWTRVYAEQCGSRRAVH